LINPNSEIDISRLATGIYFIQIKSVDHSITKKLIVNK